MSEPFIKERALSDYLKTYVKKKIVGVLKCIFKWTGLCRAGLLHTKEMKFSCGGSGSWRRAQEIQYWARFILSVIFFCFTRMTAPPRREERPEKQRARKQNELSGKIIGFNPTHSFIWITGVSVQRHTTSTLIWFHLQTTDSLKMRTLLSESVQVLVLRSNVQNCNT